VILNLPIREVLPATPRAHIVRLDLDGHPFEYAAGQAVLVGNQGSETRKPYSIACAPEDARRDGWIELLVGMDEDPQGGPPVEGRFLFIAGGSGIAPLRAMLRHALQIPHANVGLLYSARTPDDFAYESELRALADAGHIELRQTVTRAGDTIDWRGARGRIGRVELGQLVHDAETLCFVCGPPALVDEVPKLLEEIGVCRSRIRIEEWS